MEASQPLSIESFSYSWLVNLKPSFESLENLLDASDEASFIEMDPKMPPSKRFFRSSYDFNFDFPISQTPLTLVHADELFSNGYVMPVFIDPSKICAYDVSDSILSFPPSSHEPKAAFSDAKKECSSLRRCKRLSKKLFKKYLDCLRPLFQRFCGRNSSSRDEDVGSTKVHVLKSRVYSAPTSPRISVAYSVDEWRKSCESDCSIYEAVLHCKKSIGK